MTRFFVPGEPAPQGSKSGFIRGGRVVLVESSKKVKPWREAVSRVAAAQGMDVIDGPVAVHLRFVLPRPKSLPKRVRWMVKKPDVDKLVRSTLDALSGVAYVDDNRVVFLSAVKAYGDEPGCEVTVEDCVDADLDELLAAWHCEWDAENTADNYQRCVMTTRTEEES